MFPDDNLGKVGDDDKRLNFAKEKKGKKGRRRGRLDAQRLKVLPVFQTLLRV
jgi:hypothetical protein